MESLQKSGQNQGLTVKTLCRTCLTSVSVIEKNLLQTVKSIDDALAIRQQLATVTSLRNENPGLADAFVGSNILYIAAMVGIELSPIQQADLLDEVGQVGWITMADFKLFLDRVKRVKFYRKDYQELLQEFWKYADERLERAFEIETGKVDRVDDIPRTGEINHIRDLNIFKINQERNENT